MREIRSYGSVRGVVGDRYPYRDLACGGLQHDCAELSQSAESG
jgi:hypothetical protein